jgi:hypothetical protein
MVLYWLALEVDRKTALTNTADETGTAGKVLWWLKNLKPADDNLT